MAGEINYPFVECAGWPDKLKVLSASEFNSWHYVDIPYLTTNSSNSSIPGDALNVTVKLSNIFSTLSHNPADKVGRGKAIFGQSMMMRFAVHLMGDIHQPLHCTSRFSKEHPDGDLGGNDVTVRLNGRKTDLHSVWDALFQKYPEMQSPLSPDDWNTLT